MHNKNNNVENMAQNETLGFIKWSMSHAILWEMVVEPTEMDLEPLIDTLKSLKKNELHSMYLTVIKKNMSKIYFCNIVENVILKHLIDILSYEKIHSIESEIIKELELFYQE